jgi:hypothetical protein
MKNVIELEKKELDLIRVLAIKNNLPTNNQGLVNLSLRITNDVIKFLDESDFNNLFNLTK